MHIPVKELQPKLRSTLRIILQYKAADINVVATTEPVNMQTATGNGIRGFAMLYDLRKDTYDVQWGSWGGSNIAVQTNVDDNPGTAVLPPYGLLIKGTMGHPRTFAAIFAHPAALGKYLPAGKQEEPLTELEQWLIEIYCGYTSAYRKELIARNFSQSTTAQHEFFKAMDNLVELGYLKRNKAGAVSITTKGKNARNN